MDQSKILAPVWSELANTMQGEVNVGKVDCTSPEGKTLCAQYPAIKTYPTLLFFPTSEENKGRFCRYHENRKIDALKSYVKGQWKPDSEWLCKPLPGAKRHPIVKRPGTKKEGPEKEFNLDL